MTITSFVSSSVLDGDNIEMVGLTRRVKTSWRTIIKELHQTWNSDIRDLALLETRIETGIRVARLYWHYLSTYKLKEITAFLFEILENVWSNISREIDKSDLETSTKLELKLCLFCFYSISTHWRCIVWRRSLDFMVQTAVEVKI